MTHGKGLQPLVRWGFAVYRRDGKLVLVAAPRKNYVSFGYTMDTHIREEPNEPTNVARIDEAKTAALVQRLER